ncbi:polysaccharide biosynthesis protein [Seongchinamella sediminis]|uniref:Polysaccharide biosynthesis protein n=1 Tax=Seongchinamella sediminis TaxID=2283635 RepID=A0A3L7E1L1_9GAMM|nr:oligosaccharide flippase family protein [Seongchinamella sediminis]RLQ22223.1 polysaccharide biosynthesis protein [Seongchinamella sediminis]
MLSVQGQQSAGRSSLVSGTLVYLGANILNALIPFILLPVLTRYLLPAEYGEVAIFQVLLSALIGIVGLSVSGAAGRKFYDSEHDEAELAQFIASCLQILMVSAGISLLVALAFAAPLAQWLGLGLHWVIWAIIVAAATGVAQLRLSQWQVRKLPCQFGAFQVGQSALNFGLSLLLVVGLLLGAEGRIGAQIFSALAFALLALWSLWRDGLLVRWRLRRDYLEEVLRFGVPLMPHVVGNILLMYFDRFIINSVIGMSAAGLYMVAFQFSMAVMLVFTALNNAYVPWLYERLKRDDATEKGRIVRNTYLWFVVILCGAGLSFVVGPPLLRWIAGDEYAAAGDVIGILVLGQAFGGMYLMVTNYIFYSKKTGALALATLVTGAVNILLLVVLVPSHGIIGAAIAFALAMALRFGLTWWVAQLRHPMPWFQLVKAG